MDSANIYTDLLQELNAILLKMTSPEWDELSQRGNVDDRRRALRQLLDIQQMRLALGNAVLLSLAEKLKANEKDLEEGRRKVRKALDSLEEFTKVLDTIGEFVSIAARIAPLL